MKLLKVLPLLLVVSLTACNKENEPLLCFGTFVDITLRPEKSETRKNVEKICKRIDALADSYFKRDVFGVYDLNLTNDKVEISEEFYDLLYWTQKAQECAPYFNPLVGSLSEKWKESLAKSEILSEGVIQEELLKINSSSLVIEKTADKYYAQRTGEAQIDLGAIAKGYALYKCQDYLESNVDDYIINAGSSSVLLGTNSKSEDGMYSVYISDLSTQSYMRLNQVSISTSSISEQGRLINGVTYSHIINPVTGGAVNTFDAVIVINDSETYGNSAIGDALSTSLMMSSLEEVAQAENDLGVKIIAIKDDEIKYKSESLEVYHG